MRRLPSLSALRSFEEASRTLSFTKAAQNLHVTQGAISRQIRLLEDYLGTPLFMRHHHRLEITAAGKRLLPTLQAAFDSIAHTLDTIRADPSNSLLGSIEKKRSRRGDYGARYGWPSAVTESQFFRYSAAPRSLPLITSAFSKL
jgi:hypothetical protein